MLETLTLQTFAPHVGDTFRIRLQPDRAIDLSLIAARALAREPMRTGGMLARHPFALHFKGPAAVILPQQIYHLEHETIGPYDLFIVPLGPNDGGILYEAIFT